MGGIGSGRRWHDGTKDTTADYRAFDVRRLQRDRLIAPRQTYTWSWGHNGETISLIQIRTKANRLILSYQHQRHGDNR
jgi:hypothetical protein